MIFKLFYKYTYLTKEPSGHIFIPLFICALFFAALLQTEITFAQNNVEVIETEIELGQSVYQEVVPDKGPAKRPASAPASMPMRDLKGLRFEGDEIITINHSLKRAIEENQRLKQEKDELEFELKSLRGKRAIEINRINSLTQEIEQVAGKTEAILDLNKNYSKQIVSLRSIFERKEEKYQLQIKELEEKLAQPRAWPDQLASLGGAASQSMRDKNSKKNVMNLLTTYNKENTRLKLDAAQVHYNMGNSLFHKGEYKQAVGKYKRALELAPYDAATHFNLAYVSGEYLEDFETALEHYEEYLFLNPMAEDAPLVREKILDAQLEMKTRINSPINNDFPF